LEVHTQPLASPIPRFCSLVKTTMIFVNSFPVLVAIMVIATISSVASSCGKGFEPCPYLVNVYWHKLLLKPRNAQQFNIGWTRTDQNQHTSPKIDGFSSV
ncbi:hypothetical protein PSTT_03084, partial [Puccinia striiformis]